MPKFYKVLLIPGILLLALFFSFALWRSYEVSTFKGLIDTAFVLVGLCRYVFAMKNWQNLNISVKPIIVDSDKIFVDEAHSISWTEIDWQKSKIGFFRTKLVRQEAWKNKVTFWTQSYPDSLIKLLKSKSSNSRFQTLTA